MGAVRTTQRQKWVCKRYAAYRDYKKRVRLVADTANIPEKPSLDQSVKLALLVNWKKRQRPDLDNVVKGILDAIFKDDRRVLSITADAREHTGKEDAYVTIEIHDEK